MPYSAHPNIPNAITKTLVCVNSTENAEIAGLLYNPYLSEPVPFSHTVSFLTSMESFFDDIGFPQSFYEDRSFLERRQQEQEAASALPPERRWEDALFERYAGRLATFEVEVRSRLNVTWQGDVVWRERDDQRPFRSALQLLKLIDNALAHGEPSDS